MHGAHKSKNVLRGADHPQYRNAGQTKAERQERSQKSLQFALLEQLGWHLNMFIGQKTRGKKPKGFIHLDLNDPAQLSFAMVKALKKE